MQTSKAVQECEFIVLFKKVFCLLSLAFIVSGCSQSHLMPETTLDIQVQQPDRIRFSGKGAGTGIMLSSSMGPMGIAIGVAIDEGIAKEIDETARLGGFSIEELVRSAFQNSGKDLKILVKRYGYVVAVGDYPNDSVLPELILEVTHQEEVLILTYPRDLISEDKNLVLPVYPLEQLKSDSALSISAFQQALSLIYERQ